MLSFSIALFLSGLTPQTSPQSAVQDKGRLGTWYWRSSDTNIPDDEGDEIPVLETPGDTYKFVGPKPSRGILTAMAFGGFKSIQVNGDSLGQNILGDAANEPSLAFDPNNHNHIIAGWRQFDSVTSNFRQAGNAYSLDGGFTWHNQTVFTPGTFRSDPVLAANADGKFYYNSLQQTFFTDVFGSTNFGQSYINQGPATGGDKQWMTVDQTTGMGRGNLYESWSTAGNNYGGRQFSRSTDGGNSWLNPINIPGSPVWGTLDVAPNGNMYLCGLGSSTFSFCRSSNAKNPAQAPVFDRVVPVNLGGAIIYGSSINPAGLMGQTWIAADKSNGPTAGFIYMLCSVGVNTLNPCQVNFSRSTDGGLTWSSPKTINDDPLDRGVSHWFGTLSVAPSGRLDVCWYDNRANPAISNSALFVTSSFDGGTTWKRSVQVTPYFNPNIGYPNQNKMGDYLGMFSDSRGANIIYAATFNGEEDIWFLRVPTPMQSTNATAVTTYQGTYSGGGLSDIWNTDGSAYRINSSNMPGLGEVAAAQADFTLPILDANSLSVKLRGNSGLATTGMAWLYNWRTLRYDYQRSFQVAGGGWTDMTVNFTFPAKDYIDPTGKVRCVVRFLVPSRLGDQPFTGLFDQIQLLFG